jgi:hypothetical protein
VTGTLPSFEASRKAFGDLLDTILAEACDCRWCLSDLVADLMWFAVEWAPKFWR